LNTTRFILGTALVVSLCFVSRLSYGAQVRNDEHDQIQNILQRIRKGSASNWGKIPEAIVVKGKWEHTQTPIKSHAPRPSSKYQFEIPIISDTYEVEHYFLKDKFQRYDRRLIQTFGDRPLGQRYSRATDGEMIFKYNRHRSNAVFGETPTWTRDVGRESLFLLRRPIWKSGFYTINRAMWTSLLWLDKDECVVDASEEKSETGDTLYKVHVAKSGPGAMDATMWFDPHRGYNLVRSEARGNKFYWKLEVNKLVQVGNTWIPANGRIETSQGNLSVVSHKFEITESPYVDLTIDESSFSLERLSARPGAKIYYYARRFSVVGIFLFVFIMAIAATWKWKRRSWKNPRFAILLLLSILSADGFALWISTSWYRTRVTFGSLEATPCTEVYLDDRCTLHLARLTHLDEPAHKTYSKVDYWMARWQLITGPVAQPRGGGIKFVGWKGINGSFHVFDPPKPPSPDKPLILNDTKYLMLSVKLWPILLLLLIYPTLAFVRGPVRRHRRRKKGLCLHCGYNLTGNTSGACPECGERI